MEVTSVPAQPTPESLTSLTCRHQAAPGNSEGGVSFEDVISHTHNAAVGQRFARCLRKHSCLLSLSQDPAREGRGGFPKNKAFTETKRDQKWSPRHSEVN